MARSVKYPKSIGIRVTEEEHELLTARSERTGETLSQMLRLAVVGFVDRERKHREEERTANPWSDV